MRQAVIFQVESDLGHVGMEDEQKSVILDGTYDS